VVITERIRVPPRYRLLEEVGQGGMAIVYRAQDETLRREVAVKVLHPHLSAEPESKARLEREARAVAKLKHDNILEIFDYSGSNAETAYIVTEFIDGYTLKRFLGDRKLKHPETAALIAVEVGGALAHAHGLGIIHRDIKPENVMIRKDGLVKLMDFGIAQVLDLERMTVTGQLLGSPAYMAPELIEGRQLDVRTDVFSVGILLYQMVTGTLPFSGKNPHEVLRKITEGKFPDPRVVNRLCGAGLARIMTRALAHDPADRYPDMQALTNDLRESLSEAGLEDIRVELRGLFHDPAAYEAALPARMTPALTRSAARHLAVKASGKAIECWNRVLAYAPNDDEVLEALRRLEGRARLKLLARRGAAVLGVAGTAFALLALLVHLGTGPAQPVATNAPAASVTPPSPPMTPAQPPPGTTTAGERPAPETRPGAGEDEGASGRANGQPGTPAHPARVRPGGAARTAGNDDDDDTAPKGTGAGTGDPAGNGAEAVKIFALGPTPQNVDVYLDGVRQFSYDTDHRSLPVPFTTNHVVEFRSPSGCCFPERIEVGPDRPLPAENVIARKLKWKPGRLVVTAIPPAPKARVMVRDPAHPERGTVVEPGEEANIPFFPSDEGQKEIDVSMDTGDTFAAERVTIRAGERKAVVLTRKAAP
jgi:tRNA A-37 threonylcarbamoyl transferase component Bud32